MAMLMAWPKKHRGHRVRIRQTIDQNNTKETRTVAALANNSGRHQGIGSPPHA